MNKVIIKETVRTNVKRRISSVVQKRNLSNKLADSVEAKNKKEVMIALKKVDKHKEIIRIVSNLHSIGSVKVKKAIVLGVSGVVDIDLEAENIGQKNFIFLEEVKKEKGSYLKT